MRTAHDRLVRLRDPYLAHYDDPADWESARAVLGLDVDAAKMALSYPHSRYYARADDSADFDRLLTGAQQLGKGPLLDVLIIARYQRMPHYGIASFGTAATYAEALGLKDDVKKLNDATKEIYGGDEYMTKLAETSVNLQAEDA